MLQGTARAGWVQLLHELDAKLGEITAVPSADVELDAELLAMRARVRAMAEGVEGEREVDCPVCTVSQGGINVVPGRILGGWRCGWCGGSGRVKAAA